MAATPAAADLGDLPEWDLSDLYGAPDAPELAADLDKAGRDAAVFRDRHRDRLDGLTGDELAAAIAEYEAIEEALGRIMSYAGLRHAADVGDAEKARFDQNMRERVNDIATRLLFFTLEINRLDEDGLAAKLDSAALARYAPWLRDVRAFRDHQLDDRIEELLHEKSVAGRAAWVRLFDARPRPLGVT